MGSSKVRKGGLQRFRAGLPKAIDTGAKRGAEYIKDLAVQVAPKDSGDLASTGRVEGENASYKVRFGGISGTSGEMVDYAKVVEYGNPDEPNYPAQPYLTPSAKVIHVKKEILAEVKDLARRSKA